MMGNVYWGESENLFFDNTTQNSLLMYRILRNQLAADDTLVEKLRAYFLETRKSGSWRNTYESSLIMETLLPDIVAMNEKYGATSIQFAGAINQTISQFPYETRLQQFDSLQIIKTGASPVYFTAYRKYWNEKPAKTDAGFSVNSYFEKSRQKTDSLKGGEAVLLKAEVEVKADASYVMVEIPIPAGCSYQEKSQSYANNEVHREHFKNKVSLFCSELKKGKYTFSISLMPRYSGEYTLNPAKAEMMYFPVFFGREKLKTVSVK